MSFRLSSLRICCGLVAGAMISLLPCGAQTDGKQHGRPIEFSEPRSDEVMTNLEQLTVKKNGLKELEEGVYRSAPSDTSKSSLDGVAAPLPSSPVPSVIQSKRAKELLERRKNWVFMRPEDLLAEPTLEEILQAPEYGTDGRKKEQVPAMERYYERLTTKRPAATRPDQLKDDNLFGPAKKSGSSDETATHDDSDLPSGLKESTQALKSLFQPDAGGALSARSETRSSFWDPFDLGDNTLSKEQLLEHKKLMDEYRSVVDPSWHPPAVANSFNQPLGLPEALQPMRSPAAGLPSSPLSVPHTGLDAQMDVLNPVLGPAALPDVNAQALGQSRPALAPPNVDVPKVVAPTFTAPKRAF
ncbi:MAG: hypothetical protein ACLQU3_34725 [Limisphaerales bacterium]